MQKITYDHIHRIANTEADVLERASRLRRSMNRRFGPGSMTIQAAVDSVIDALIEDRQ